MVKSTMKTLLAVFVACLTTSHAFMPAKSYVAEHRIGRLFSDVESTGWDSFRNARPIKDISYGEDSRKYRRTVYTHDDWKKHRSADRFFYYISAIFSSGVYRNLGREVTATVAVATFVCFYNILVGSWQDLSGMEHAGLIQSPLFPKLGLPLAPFTLASPSLGLLLGTCPSVAYLFCRITLVSSARLGLARTILTNPFLFFYSLSYQHLLPTLGRSPKELGNEYQPYP